MHKVKSAERRRQATEDQPKRKSGKQAARQPEPGRLRRWWNAIYDCVKEILSGWLDSPRLVMIMLFHYGMISRICRNYDKYEDILERVMPIPIPGYLLSVFSVWTLSTVFCWYTGHPDASHAPQVFAIFNLMGVVEGAIVEELTEGKEKVSWKEKSDFIACSMVLSLAIYILRYEWLTPVTRYAKILLTCVAPAWFIVLANFVSLYRLPKVVALFLLFTVAASVIDFFVQDVRRRFATTSRIFSPVFIGALTENVMHFLMISYLVSVRTDTWPEPTPTWEIALNHQLYLPCAGVVVAVVAVAHALHVFSQWLSGVGPHNYFFMFAGLCVISMLGVLCITHSLIVPTKLYLPY